MSFSEDRTSELWREFRTRESKIKNRIGSESYSVKVYRPEYSFAVFDPGKSFEKWAAAAVGEPDHDFETLEISSGLYAVFAHIGPAEKAPVAFEHIFEAWLPNSGFVIDSRPHFEMLPEGYDPFDPTAEEEIWLPIRQRTT